MKYIFLLAFFSMMYAHEGEVVITSDASLEFASRFALARERQWKNKEALFFKKHNISYEDVRKTLVFTEHILNEDKKNKRKVSRLHDTAFLQKHFEWIPLKPNVEQALEQRTSFPPCITEQKLEDQMLLTKYASFKIPGSLKKTDHYSCALYASRDYDNKIQKTKQEILSGALNEHSDLYKPLVWVTRKGLEKALMQGTVVVALPNKEDKIFYVHTHNGYAYDVKKNASDQERYWFFKEVQNEKKLPEYHTTHLLKTDHASFAGDVRYFGMGSFITVLTQNPINRKMQRILGFLVDVGGALKDNQYQLDLFVGLCESDQLFQEKIKSLSESGVAHMLIKKRASV